LLFKDGSFLVEHGSFLVKHESFLVKHESFLYFIETLMAPDWCPEMETPGLINQKPAAAPF
jgi:hypothetical protein